jgi:DNA-binding response OmpR family regulator
MEIMTKQRVLIIDDDHAEVMITRRAISKIAPELGTDVAYNGEAGLTLLRSGNTLPALILLDLKLPGLSGIDVLRQIRSDASLKHLPVIIVTNSTLESDKQESVEAGADNYLHKTFEIDQFIRDIKALLEHHLTN